MHRTGNRAIVNTRLGSVELPILCPSDFLELGRQCRQQRKTELMKNARAAGAASESVLQLLNEFDARPWRHADTIGYLNTDVGASAAVLRSIRKSHSRAGPHELDRLGIPPGRMLEAAAAVCRLKLVKSPAMENKPDPFPSGGKVPSATAPPDSWPPIETGDSRPT
jgi:hypothetical protein